MANMSQSIAKTVSFKSQNTPEAMPVVDVDTLPLTISIFNNEKDNDPHQLELTWSQLVTKLQQSITIRVEKKGGMAMSPVSYKPGMKRGNKSVDLVFCAVFDVEHHGPFEALQEKLDGYAYVAHSSYRHTVEAPRFRIILPLNQPIPANQWPHAWERLNLWLGGINDPATKDAARLYYLPSQPPGATGHFIVRGDGRPMDISELPEVQAVEATRAVVLSMRESTPLMMDGIEDASPEPLNPAGGLEKVVARCKFMSEVALPKNQKVASRSIWMAMVSNASRFEKSEDWIHEASCHHDSYGEHATDKLIQSCRKFGMPITCAKIKADGYPDCPSEGCKTFSGKITKAPAGLWQGGGDVLAVSQSTGLLSDYWPQPVTEFHNACFSGGLIYTNEGFLGYEHGYWRRLDDRAEVRHRIAMHMGKSVTKPEHIGNLFELLKDYLAVRETDFVPNKNLICLRNGTLDTSTYQLLQHSADHGLANMSDIEWNSKATCHRWLQFLEEIFAHDSDKAQKIVFLQEWFGYCLIPDVSQHKFVWMIGSGGNGKSVLLGILTTLVGAQNVGHAHLERLDKGHVRAELEGKLVNISSEMSAEATIADGYLKAIVAGDMLEAERKFKPPFSFKPYVRLIGATNHLPRLLDLSEGFFRRAIVLTFNRQFVGAEIDPGLEEKLRGELPGILTWAMRGLQQLRARGSFDVPQSSITELAKYRQDSDAVALFAEACMVSVTEGGMRSASIYAGYTEWCTRNGFSRKNVTGFGKRLAELGFVSYRSATGNCWRVMANENDDNVYLWQQDEEHDLPVPQVPASKVISVHQYKF